MDAMFDVASGFIRAASSEAANDDAMLAALQAKLDAALTEVDKCKAMMAPLLARIGDLEQESKRLEVGLCTS
jgi:hypothetical protein